MMIEYNLIDLIKLEKFMNIQHYDPLKWPPSYQLAQLHLKCICPGRDNINGVECPCCSRFEKVKLKNWLCRSVLKDFKNYGGAIPGYVELVKYCWVVFAIITLIVTIYHIYIIQITCPLIRKRFTDDIAKLRENECQPFLVVFQICGPKLLYQTLLYFNRNVEAYILLALQSFSFCALILATVGMKLWLQRINYKKIEKQQKVYSNYSLLLKNIPKFYQLENIRLQLLEIVPGVSIVELFFVYQIAEFQTQFKKLFDLYYQILYIKDSVATERGQTIEKLQQKVNQYKQLYQKVENLRKRIGTSNGRAIVVFNSIKQRDQVYHKLNVNQCSKFIYHTCKLFGYNTMNLHLFPNKILQPSEINWKYIGQSSQKKNQLKIITSVLGFGFIVLCFLLFYFPMIKVRQMDIQNHSLAITILSLVISLILQCIAIGYRLFILRIVPMRQPSSRQAESYFIVMTTVVFHFLFYLLVPGTYYQMTKRIPDNIKLKQLFIAVVIFLVMTIIVGFFNLRYRLFNNRRRKIMSTYSGWGKFCQIRLHEQIRWPSFPIQYKIMVILNIWSFNAYYTFQVPYLLLFFLVTLSIIIFIDKRILYNHYKMQVYQSIESLLSIQRDYIIMFLICVCCGYALCASYNWQYYLIGALFIVCLLVNWLITLSAQKKEKLGLKNRAMTLSQVVKAKTKSLHQSFIMNLKNVQLKQQLLIADNASTVSLGSTIFQYGYKQTYDNYLNQFKNKRVNNLLEQEYKKLINLFYKIHQQVNQIRKMNHEPQKARVSEMKKINKIIIQNTEQQKPGSCQQKIQMLQMDNENKILDSI